MTATWRQRLRVGIRHCLLMALLVASAGALADWRRDYGFGQQAIDKGNWAEAESLMRSAQSEEPAAALRKRMQGTRFEAYVPRHYAGYAAFKQGACGRALDYFNDASTRDVVAQVPELAAQAQQVRRGCGGADNTVADTGKPPVPTAAVIDKPVVAAPEPPPRAVPTPTPPTVANTPPKPAPTPVQAPVTAPAATHLPAPAALRSVIGLFLAGNYDAALRASDAGMSDPRARALLLLVRAAAGFTNAELKGGDAAAVARAEQDVRASRRLMRIDPDPILFSPKVRAQIARIR